MAQHRRTPRNLLAVQGLPDDLSPDHQRHAQTRRTAAAGGVSAEASRGPRPLSRRPRSGTAALRATRNTRVAPPGHLGAAYFRHVRSVTMNLQRGIVHGAAVLA